MNTESSRPPPANAASLSPTAIEQQLKLAEARVLGQAAVDTQDAPVRFVTAFSHALPPGDHCAPHRHPCVEIIYHAAGTGRTHTADGDEWSFAPGTVVVHQPHQLHEQWMNEAGIDHCLLVAPQPGSTVHGQRSFHLPALRNRFLIRELEDITSWTPTDDALGRHILDLRAAAVLAALWREACESRPPGAADPPGGAWVRQARRLVAEHLDTLGTVSDLARRLGISADHLRHVFTEETGQSPKQYLLDARIRRASDLLRHSPATLDDIASTCGFANARQLCTTFRQRTGETPGTFRTRHRH